MLFVSDISFVINHNRFTVLISDVISDNHLIHHTTHFACLPLQLFAMYLPRIYPNFRNVVLGKEISIDVRAIDYDIYGEVSQIWAAIDH